jgi:ribonucleoside-diphosphate reductase alpha chain
MYDDGRPGELFIKMAKQGSTLSGFADAVGILTSIMLQCGIPLEVLASKLQHMRFEPCGWTPNPDMPHAHSIVDYIFRWLLLTFGDNSSNASVD